jgi:NAD(P)-dependent dehydrogenase (short-subunit alcohol dehydrogenase family)
VLRPDGSLTFITAGSAGAAIPGTAGLAAVNAAVEAMVPVLAVELAPARVNAVSPGIDGCARADARTGALACERPN